MENKTTPIASRALRPLRDEERSLIFEMVKALPVQNQVLSALADAMVSDMNDGGMGSIEFCGASAERRVFGLQVSEVTYVDADGVSVSITLNLDQHGDLFELDIFKADNTALKVYPRLKDVTLIVR
jgi:hypothetical protein